MFNDYLDRFFYLYGLGDRIFESTLCLVVRGGWVRVGV